jgi:hypothetical protein
MDEAMSVIERNQLVTAAVQALGQAARQMVEHCLAADNAAAKWDLAAVLDEAEALAVLGAEFRGIYERFLIAYIRPPRRSADPAGADSCSL